MRTPQQLVTGKGDQIEPISHRFEDGSLVRETVIREVDERAATEVFDGGDAGPPAEGRQCIRRDVGDKAFDRKVRAMATQQERRARRQRLFEVAQVDFVGRADFDQRRAAAREDFGESKAAADLDQLVARDDDLAAFCKGVEDQQHGRRAVVDDQGFLGAAELAQQSADASVARTARPALEFELEVRVSGGDGRDRFEGFARERRAPEIGMEQNARSVDQFEQPVAFGGGQTVAHGGDDRLERRNDRVFAGIAAAQRPDDGGDRIFHGLGPEQRGESRDARLGEEPVHRWDITQRHRRRAVC